jgi:uncharacterized protein (TIGR03435 family)
MGRTIALSIAVMLLIPLAPVHSQSHSFDAVSIKRDTTESGASTRGFQPGGRFEATNEPLVRLIAFAYATGADLPRTQILGGPNWIDTDRFDVRASLSGRRRRDGARDACRTVSPDRAL